MGTEYLNTSLSDYAISKIETAESGELYNYYLYIHSAGASIIMRENIEGTEYLYASAGRSGSNWSTRAELDYITFDKLAKG